MSSKVDTSDPQVRRLVYNMYRDMLGTYNDKANDILSALPKERVREDQGIARQLESMIRQSSQISGGGTSSPGPGGPGAPSGDGVTANAAPTFPAPPAPPPPPPPGPAHIPAVRLNTEITDTRGPNRGSTYEPPAAIQNAMMTKDKKPFTYTPGGLDLSQIRSPRMQRRITRNANAEGVGEQPTAPKTSPLVQQPQGTLPPSAVAAMQPQMAVPVFPTGGGGLGAQLHHVGTAPGFHSAPPPPPAPTPAPAPPPMQSPPPVPTVVKTQAPSPRPVPKAEPVSPPVQSLPPQPMVTKVQAPAPRPIPSSPPHNEPGSIYVPPVSGNRVQLGSLYIPSIQPTQQPPPPSQAPPPPTTPMSPIHGGLNKAPTPWMSQRPQQPSVPTWAARDEAQPGTHIIPIQVEGREPPTPPSQPAQTMPTQSSQSANTRIIPIQFEGTSVAPQQRQQQQQQLQQQRKPVYAHNKFSPPTPTLPTTPSPSEVLSEQNPRQLQQQQSWGPPGSPGAPIQSRSFRVLQKITDTDNSDGTDQSEQYQEYPHGNQWNQPQSTQGVPIQQLRKLQLNEDDRALMNKFKAQVSEETPMNEEENPRYRGGHIPSRVFKMLDDSVPRGPGPVRAPQARPTSASQPGTADSAPQPYIPPSEQQVPEPRKYTGGAIPSRSFRILQAMTASPENCGPGQSDM